jgi:PEP-CTERM motif
MKLSTCAAVTMLALAAIPGRVDAAIVIDISDIGSDVVASTRGSADLTDLTAIDTALLFAPGEVTPSKGSITAGDPGQILFYKGADGPKSFGTGGKTEASVGNGDFVGVFAVNPFALSPVILLPQKYASGTPLKGSSVFEGQSLESLGLTVGEYTYTWGVGEHADSLTIKVGDVPEPSTWAMMLLGFAGLGFAGYRKAKQATVTA